MLVKRKCGLKHCRISQMSSTSIYNISHQVHCFSYLVHKIINSLNNKIIQHEVTKYWECVVMYSTITARCFFYKPVSFSFESNINSLMWVLSRFLLCLLSPLWLTQALRHLILHAAHTSYLFFGLLWKCGSELFSRICSVFCTTFQWNLTVKEPL